MVGEDNVLLRAGMVRLLQDAGFDVVAQAGDRDDVLRKVRAHRPDVAVIDIRMPPDHSDEGLQAAKTIRAELPDVGVLVLSAHLEERYARELLADGAEGVGYLLKDRVAEIERFIAAVDRVARGGSVLDPEVVSTMIRGRSDSLDELTPRERQVLGLMAEGRSNRGIADSLYVSERAVERHVTAIFTKLELLPAEHVHRRVLAVLAHLRGSGLARCRPSGPVSHRPSSCGSSSHACGVGAAALDQRVRELGREEQIAEQLAVQRVALASNSRPRNASCGERCACSSPP